MLTTEMDKERSITTNLNISDVHTAIQTHSNFFSFLLSMGLIYMKHFLYKLYLFFSPLYYIGLYKVSISRNVNVGHDKYFSDFLLN